MILHLLERVVKSALHSATEEWLPETGVPREMIDEVRNQREALVAERVTQADNLDVRRLGVDDEQDAHCAVPALPMPSAARVTQPGGADLGDLMGWVHMQRQGDVSWAEIAEDSSQKGCQNGEDALRSRYKRWREEHAEADLDSVTA